MIIRNPLEELKDTKLYQYLSEIDSEYSGRIIPFVEDVSPILSTIVNYFPHYTRHDAHHGYRVTQRIHQILFPNCIISVNPGALCPVEVFLLIASAYAHDIGMTIFPGEEEKIAEMFGIKSADLQTNKTVLNYLRNHHSKRGGDYISDNAEKLGVPLHLIGPLDWMMKSHNLSIPELDCKLAKPFAAQEKIIDVRQLSVLLCIGDALEFSDTRVLDGVFNLLKADSSHEAQISYLENMKHVCVGDSVAIDIDGRIVVSGTFSDAEVLAISHHTFDQMEEWIRGYCDIERNSIVRRIRVRPEPFSRNLELRGARFERLGVRMSKKSIIDLISSNAIWKQNSGVAIRELVQNSVEACRYRRYHTPESYSYVPQVKIVFDRDNHTITVCDNGCGMSERVVLNNLLSVGNSRSRDPGYVVKDYFPIARFGIGFWSVFTIASSADIDTASFEDSLSNGIAQGVGFNVALHELKDYTVFIPKELQVGTKVVLHLVSDVVIDDIYEKFRSQMLCSEIPIILTLDAENVEIPNLIPDVTESDLFGSRQRLKDELDIKFFVYRGSSGDIDLTLGLGYTVRDGQVSFLKDEHNSVSTVLPHGINRSRTSLCGFCIPATPSGLCFDLSRVGNFFANCWNPGGFEFTIDRNNLLNNEASKDYASKIPKIIHDGYREFLVNNNSYNPKTIFNLNRQAAMHGGNVYDSFTEDELNKALINFPDLLCFRLYKVELNKNLDSCEIDYLDLNQLIKNKGIVYFIQNSVSTTGVGKSRGMHIELDSIKPIALEYAKQVLSKDTRSELHPIYLGDANRQMSMLFDADPTSTAVVINAALVPGQLFPICIQIVYLSNVKYDCSQQNILAKVKGPWSGTLYMRSFLTPERKPYYFLGRNRVLIHPSSHLCAHIKKLLQLGRLVKIAELISQLQEADYGFPPKEIEELLLPI